MSYVTDVILTYPLRWTDDDEEHLNRLNDYFRGTRGEYGLGLVNGHKVAGGTKALQVNIAVGAFNYLNLDSFVAYLRKFDWTDSGGADRLQDVQLFVKEEHDDHFREVRLI